MAQIDRPESFPSPQATPGVNWFDKLIGTSMVRRALSGVVLIAIALAVLWVGDWLLALWVSIAGARMAFEWERMVHGRVDISSTVINAATVVAAVLLTWKGLPLIALGAVLMGTTTSVSWAALHGTKPGWSLVGIPYIAIPTAAFMWLGMHLEGQAILIWMLVTVWATDSGAYIVGSIAKGPKLWPSLSPKKTWSGLIGGTICAAIAGALAAHFLDAPSPATAATTSVVMSIVCQLGDLLESAFKRRFQVKDAGGLIPGHGGALDRLDGLMAVSAATALLTLVYPGGPLGLVIW